MNSHSYLHPSYVSIYSIQKPSIIVLRPGQGPAKHWKARVAKAVWIKYAWLANEVSATDNTPLCANLCKFLTDTLIKSRQSLTEIRACKHVIVCIVHTEATRTSKE